MKPAWQRGFEASVEELVLPSGKVVCLGEIGEAKALVGEIQAVAVEGSKDGTHGYHGEKLERETGEEAWIFDCFIV